MNKKQYISIFGCSVLLATIILSTTNDSNIAFGQHEDHNMMNMNTEVFDTETVLLDGKVIPAKNFIMLYTSSPSKISQGHIQAHLPCDANGVTKVKVIGGEMITPDVEPLNMMLDPMSTLGMICMYHIDIAQQTGVGITDIALLNPTEQNITLPDMTSTVIHVSAIDSGVGKQKETSSH
jgi:hypothetical protein